MLTLKHYWVIGAAFLLLNLAVGNHSIAVWAQPAIASSEGGSARAPLYTDVTGQRIAGQYIVVYKPERAFSADATADLVRSVNGTLLFTYHHAIQGFAVANLSAEGLARLQTNPAIAYIQQNQMVTLATTPSYGNISYYLPAIQGGGGVSTPTPTGTITVSPTAAATSTVSPTATSTPPLSATPSTTSTNSPTPSGTATTAPTMTAAATSTATPTVSPTATPAVETQEEAPWGLDRIDQRTLPLNTTYTYRLTGKGVHAYIINTGIRASHTDFTGRVGTGFDAVDGGAPTDCNGAGTHVAATLGGNTYGVAKEVTLHGIRVLGCNGNGTIANVIEGIEWIAQNYEVPAVAAISVVGGDNPALDDATQGLIEAGVIVVVQAGNSNTDACNSSPAGVTAALTVAASTIEDERWENSNHGSCVDVFAPGKDILSAWYTSDTASNTVSGTSMATPHVAGIVALLLSEHPTYTQSQVADVILDTATPDVISDPQGSPNRLLFTPYGATLPWP